MTAELPSDSSRKRRIALVVAIALGVVLLLGGGAWAVFGRSDEAPRQTAIEPAEETSATTMPPVPGSESSGSAGATGSASPGDPQAPEDAPADSGPSKVVFRLGNRLYVANDDGSESVSVVDAAQSYSLSPDGRTLAVVYGEGEPGQAGVVTLADVATGLTRPAGRGAVPVEPSWAPDSSWIAYTALKKGGMFELKAVGSDAKGDSVVVSPGARPAVSGDGKSIAFKQTDQQGLDDPLMVLAAGAKTALIVAGGEGAMAWTWGPGEALYFTRPGSSEGTWEVWVWKGRGAADRIGSISLSTPAHALDDLMISPDGSQLVVSAIGDDDYSRLMVFTIEGSRFFSINTRRDAYPAGWSSDGRVLYFEGNAYQGEASALMSVRPDGTGRRMLVSGAQP